MEDKFELHVIAPTRDLRERAVYALTELCQTQQISGVYLTDAYGDIKFYMGTKGNVINPTESPDTA